MATPRLAESGSRRLSDSLSRGVDDSPTRWVGELATPRLAESGSRRLSDSPSFSFKHSKADSPTRRVGESATPRLADSLSRGVIFRLRISPRIRSQKRNGSKDSVRDLWGTNFCKNPRKSASLPCPFNLGNYTYNMFANNFLVHNMLSTGYTVQLSYIGKIAFKPIVVGFRGPNNMIY